MTVVSSGTSYMKSAEKSIIIIIILLLSVPTWASRQNYFLHHIRLAHVNGGSQPKFTAHEPRVVSCECECSWSWLTCHWFTANPSLKRYSMVTCNKGGAVISKNSDPRHLLIFLKLFKPLSRCTHLNPPSIRSHQLYPHPCFLPIPSSPRRILSDQEWERAIEGLV